LTLSALGDELSAERRASLKDKGAVQLWDLTDPFRPVRLKTSMTHQGGVTTLQILPGYSPLGDS